MLSLLYFKVSLHLTSVVLQNGLDFLCAFTFPYTFENQHVGYYKKIVMAIVSNVSFYLGGSDLLTTSFNYQI